MLTQHELTAVGGSWLQRPALLKLAATSRMNWELLMEGTRWPPEAPHFELLQRPAVLLLAGTSRLPKAPFFEVHGRHANTCFRLSLCSCQPWHLDLLFQRRLLEFSSFRTQDRTRSPQHLPAQRWPIGHTTCRRARSATRKLELAPRLLSQPQSLLQAVQSPSISWSSSLSSFSSTSWSSSSSSSSLSPSFRMESDVEEARD
jgi:hypothetical protein